MAQPTAEAAAAAINVAAAVVLPWRRPPGADISLKVRLLHSSRALGGPTSSTKRKENGP